MADIIEEMCETLYAITQQTMRICSFSKSIKSAYMWGQYSDDEKGFCIEYDFCSASDYYKTVENKMAFGVFYPVIYSAERYSVTDDYIGYLIQYRLHFYNAMNSREFANVRDIQNYINTFLVCPDLCVATKIALYKSIEWQYEKEWRLILDIVNEPLSNQADHLCIIKRPSAIYLGRRISSLNEKILKRLAEEKRIPVYKMRLDDASPSYRLIPEPV